jgi:DNA-binding beta-propeller fold protein YncE
MVRTFWIAISGSNSVSKIRARDGAVVGTFSVGDTPDAIAFDDANIWAANGFGNTVTKLWAIDGKILGTFPTGKNLLAFLLTDPIFG